MFNFGITEIMLIAVIGLVVIGPERLPKVARTLGHMFGRMQRYVSDVKSDISKEMQLEELKSLQKTMQETAEEVQESVSQQVNFIETEIKDADGWKSYLNAQAEITQQYNDKLVESTKNVVELGNAYSNEIQRIVKEAFTVK